MSKNFHRDDISDIKILDHAISQDKVKKGEGELVIEKTKDQLTPTWDIHKDIVVYHDERYTLGIQADRPYLIANSERYTLTCHPYEPCLYITDKYGSTTTVHNAFDPFYALEAFHSGKSIRSITKFEYDAKDFCRMIEYASDMLNINIDDAEKIFEDSSKKKISKQRKENEKHDKNSFHPEIVDCIICNDPFYNILNEYPDTEVEFCLVKNDHISKGREAHRHALVCACRNMFFEDKEQIWHYDCSCAVGKQINLDDFFATTNEKCGVNYRGAFLYSPHGVWYLDKDFDRVNTTLFPNGTNMLEIYEWTTDWSEYFDEGHEWWGAICITIYDESLDRFVVIMASATD